MQTLTKIILTISLCANLLIGGVLIVVRANHSKTKLQLAESRLSLTNAQALALTRQQSAEMLESRMQRMTEILTNSTAQLREANERIQGYELAERERAKKQATPQTMVAQVPAPKITIEKDGTGRETKSFLFPVVMDREGNVLGRNAKFGKLYGRRLSFWPESGTIMVDVEQIHPEILGYLGIDSESAKLAQAKTDAAWRSYHDAAQKEAERQFKVQAEVSVMLEKQRLEREKADAEIAKQRADERAVLEAAQNERIKAQAAAKAADAAMIEATKTAPQTIIQNANQNIIYR